MSVSVAMAPERKEPQWQRLATTTIEPGGSAGGMAVNGQIIIKTAHKMLQIIPFLLLNQRSPEIVQR